MRVTPAKMDTSCCRKRIITGVKVRMCFFAELPTLFLAYMCCIIKGYTLRKKMATKHTSFFAVFTNDFKYLASQPQCNTDYC